ncbi:MAG: thioesterase family protein [Anaerolineales bacterium]
MDLSTIYQIGQTREETFTVEGKHTAYHIGSGDSRVLSTPSMISFMEQVSHRLLGEKIPQGVISVGIQVDIKHLAATPVGATVRVKTELAEIRGSRVLFQVTAWDEEEKIGTGQHWRAVIEEERFKQGVTEKRQG